MTSVSAQAQQKSLSGLKKKKKKADDGVKDGGVVTRHKDKQECQREK